MSEKSTGLPSIFQPPQPSGADKAYTILKAAVAGIPIVGGSANELMGLVFAGPYQKRLQKWREDVAEVLSYLVNTKGIRIEDLQSNEGFISAVANASQVAMRNHDAEKREALRNALINTVISDTIDESLQNQFLNYIDTLTVWHIRLLKAFFSPQPKEQSGRYSTIPSSPADMLEETYPALLNRRDIYDPFWRDLHSRGLVNIDQLHVMMTPQGVYTKRTTAIGDQFIKFISLPESGR
jgi:hypothetical protein